MVETRIADYLRYFARAGATDFDVWHAQDGISANALAALKAQGRIPGFARTVHHVDHFADCRACGLAKQRHRCGRSSDGGQPDVARLAGRGARSRRHDRRQRGRPAPLLAAAGRDGRDSARPPLPRRGADHPGHRRCRAAEEHHPHPPGLHASAVARAALAARHRGRRLPCSTTAPTKRPSRRRWPGAACRRKPSSSPAQCRRA